MTTELQMLALSALLALAQMLIAVVGAMAQVGLPTLAGNREGLAEPTGWAGRARRAHLNMLESLAIFAIAVLVVHLADRSSDTTALGAALFFWARLAYAAVYLAGIPWLRTGVWFVSVVGLAIIFAQLWL